MTIDFDRSNVLQARLHEVVPGGAHTFAKGSDQYPEDMAPVLVRGSGARSGIVDGNEFVEYGMGMRAVTLGHGYGPVVEAVRAAIGDGVSFTRPTELELAAAEDFLIWYRRGHGEVLQERLRRHEHRAPAGLGPRRGARSWPCATTSPLFASQDWFVGTLPINTGVPAAVRSLVRGFGYNDLESLRAGAVGRTGGGGHPGGGLGAGRAGPRSSWRVCGHCATSTARC